MRVFEFEGADGTTLTAWSNEAEGPPVLLCNGLAAPASAWPGFLSPDCGFHVVSWNQRGFLGSQRPDDVTTVEIPAQAHDALALMEHMQWEDALVVGWSFGVNMAVEFTMRNPQRTTALLAIAGLPGGTFKGLLGNSNLPVGMRQALGKRGSARGAKRGPLINRAVESLPSPATLVDTMRTVGALGRRADPVQAEEMVGDYLTHDFGWFFQVASVVGAHETLDPSTINCPVTVLTGREDLITDYRQVIAWGDEVPDAQVRVLKATHFIPLERPDVVLASLQDLLIRSGQDISSGPDTTESDWLP